MSAAQLAQRKAAGGRPRNRIPGAGMDTLFTDREPTQGESYAEARCRREIAEADRAEIARDTALLEFKRAQKQYFTAKDVQEMRDREDDAIDAELACLPDAWSASVPPEMKMAIHRVAREWLTAYRAAVSAKLSEIRA